MSSGPRTARPLVKQTVKWFRSESEIDADVWQQCFPSEVEGRFWYKALEQSKLQDQFQFFYAVVYTDRPIAIAPCFLMDVPMSLVVPEELAPAFAAAGTVFSAFRYQRTFSIGSPCADEGTVGILTGHTLSDVTGAIQKAAYEKGISLKASMIIWKDFPGETWAALGAMAKSHGLFEMVSFPGAVVDFANNGGAGSYYKNLKASRRQKIMKKLRSSNAQVEVDVEILQHPEQSVRDELFGLFWQTYEKGKVKFEKLTPEFFTQIAATDEAWFILLRESKTREMVAFMLCFKVGERIINKFIGLDYSRPSEWFLYFRLWDEMIKWCAAENATELQSGQTGYSAKIELGHRLVPLKNYCKNTNPIMNMVYEHVAKSISWSTLDADLALYLKKYPTGTST